MLHECVTHVLQELTAAGVTASNDARNLSLPGVWVTPDTFSSDRLVADSASVTLALVLVTNTAGGQALTDLDELLSEVLTILDPNPDWTAASIRLPNHSADPLPALRGSITLDWSRS